MRMVLMALVVGIAGCASANRYWASAASATSDADHKARASSMAHFLASVMHERAGDYEAALDELRKAADLSPESSNLQIKLLGAYYASKDYENAAIMAERVVKEDPDNVVYLIWLGRIYHQLGEIEKATKALEKAIAVDPKNTVAYEALADIEEETNDLIGAIDMYEKLVELSPNSPFLHYRLGLNYFYIDNAEGAIRELNAALALSEDLNPARLLVGGLYFEQKEYDRAATYFSEFLEKEAGSEEAKSNLAASYAATGKIDEAIELLTELISNTDAHPQYHLSRTFLMLRKGGLEDPSLVAAPNGAPLLGTLLQAIARKHADEPYAPLLDTLEDTEGDIDHESSAYLNYLLTYYGEDGGADFLEAQIRGLLEDGARYRVVEMFLGRLLMAREASVPARDTLLRVREEFGSNKNLEFYLATISDDLDDFPATESHLLKCLEFDGADPDVLNFLGYLYAEENTKLDEAKDLVEKALAIEPDNGFYLDSLGWIHYRLGNADKAIENIDKAIRNMRTDDAILRDHLGDAYLLKGNTERAIEEWERALRLDPEVEGVQEKLEAHRPAQ